METERSPLGRKSVPRYTFIGSDSDHPKLKVRWFQCCICATVLALLITALIIILSIYLSPNYANKHITNNSEALDGLLELNWPLRDESYPDQPILDENNQERAFNAGIESLKEREVIENIIQSVPVDSPSFQHQLATYTSNEAQELSRTGYILNLGAKEIMKCLTNTTTWKGKYQKPKKWIFDHAFKWVSDAICEKNVITDCQLSPYRNIDGTCNNLIKDKTWGAAFQSYRRILLPQYEDGISEPRKATDGSALPSAREISLAIHRPIYRNDVNFTIMLAVWGQFIDHDITATAISKGKNGTAILCCNKQKIQHPECYPVPIKKSDPFYKKYNITCMNFVRSLPATINAFGPREQLNQVTSFLDGSMVYGVNQKLTNQLRTFEGGKLKMQNTPFGELLPISNDPDDGCNREEELKRGRYCFLSGDARSNENLLLTSMHLLFARQHNMIARELAKMNKNWTDEKIFQEVRKIISAQIQHITYNEFLPSLLPEKLIKRLNMTIKSSSYANFYNSSVNPSISNVFASAAFRFGHSLLPGLIQFVKENSTHKEYMELHKMLFNPFRLFEIGFLENFMKGALNTSAERADVNFNKELTQKLFQKKERGPCGLDLVSLNIQRGRDHGLPSYPNWPTICGFNRPKSFDDLKSTFDEDTLKRLQKLYKSVDDLDLFTGALAEIPVNGGLIGPTFTCLIADQFLRLKIGDRFWYETGEAPQRFTEGQLNEIRKTTLGKIICKTSEVDKAQPNVMKRVGINNELQPCDDFLYPNFEPWREK